MLPISFILAVLLAAEGVVLAHPIHYARRNEYSSIAPRAVSDNNPAVSLTQERDGPQNWLGIGGYDVDGVETRGLSDLEDLEIRGFVGEGKEKMERRKLYYESAALMARRYDGGEWNVTNPGHGNVVKVPYTSRFHEEMDPSELPEEATQSDSESEPEAPKKPSTEIDSEQGSYSEKENAPAQKDNNFTSHPVMKKISHYSKTVLDHSKKVKEVSKAAVVRVVNHVKGKIRPPGAKGR